VDEPGTERSTRPGIQAALTVVGRRDPDANFNGATLTGADLTDARWPEGELVPEGWRLDTGSGRLEQAGTGSRQAEAGLGEREASTAPHGRRRHRRHEAPAGV